jgi:hypothetical protein
MGDTAVLDFTKGIEEGVYTTDDAATDMEM